MRNYLIFDGEDSRDYGVYITGSGVFNAPGRALDEVAIPGRDGLFLMDDRHLENIEVTYPCFIYANYKENIKRFRNMLMSRYSTSGYLRLTDSYHPDEYRMAACPGPIEIEPTAKLDAGSFDLTFNCRPQRWLTSGEAATSFTSDGTITNPTEFTAKPLIIAYGTGQFNVGNYRVEILSGDQVYFDSELMDAYLASQSKNRNIKLINGGFPKLSPGSNVVKLGTGIRRLTITPRWWRV